MTELMKRYEAETGERATFVYTWEDSEGNEKHGNITTGGFDVWAIREAERLNEENAKLKDQLRWRPVSEKPESDEQYLCRWQGEGCFVALYKNETWFIWDDELEEYVKLIHLPYKWLPIPPAQEGEQQGVMVTILGIDCCKQEIIPINENVTLEVHTNRHPNIDGTAWGWIDGCTLNVCWSDDGKFTRAKATELVNNWNRRKSDGKD